MIRPRFFSVVVLALALAGRALAQAPNDHFYPQSWHHQQIGSEAAWAINGGSRSVVVAVIDTGVDANHPDLAGHVVPGWNVYADTPDTSPMAYHGTSVAGVIAATRNNSIGVAGVADVSIMPIIASGDPGGMSDLDASFGIRWAADHGAKVINISAGLLQGVRLHEAAMYAWDKGSLVVIASVNDDSYSSKQPWAEVVSVSASGHDDNRYNSEYGQFLDLLAPGQEIYSRYWDSAGQFQYAIGQGSSFAAPMVSAAAALAWSINPQLTNAQVRDMLYATADDLNTPGYDQETGWGRLNVGALASAAAASVPEPGICGVVWMGAVLICGRRRKWVTGNK
jgi:thermitase